MKPESDRRITTALAKSALMGSATARSVAAKLFNKMPNNTRQAIQNSPATASQAGMPADAKPSEAPRDTRWHTQGGTTGRRARWQVP